MNSPLFHSLILLAGGKGTRFGSPLPKQYALLKGKPLALYSFEFFLSLPRIDEIIVVCEEEYKHYFKSSSKPVFFALPGARRQDSVYAGLLKTSSQADFVLTHDAARPFVEKDLLLPLLEAAHRTGAAALGVAAVNTIKLCDSKNEIIKTLDRSQLWEMQTPQILKRSLFFSAFQMVHEQQIEITDDVSLAEWVSHPAEVVPSSPKNFKITTPLDLRLAEVLCATN